MKIKIIPQRRKGAKEEKAQRNEERFYHEGHEEHEDKERFYHEGHEEHEDKERFYHEEHEEHEGEKEKTEIDVAANSRDK